MSIFALGRCRGAISQPVKQDILIIIVPNVIDYRPLILFRGNATAVPQICARVRSRVPPMFPFPPRSQYIPVVYDGRRISGKLGNRASREDEKEIGKREIYIFPIVSDESARQPSRLNQACPIAPFAKSRYRRIDFRCNDARGNRDTYVVSVSGYLTSTETHYDECATENTGMRDGVSSRIRRYTSRQTLLARFH